MKKDGGWIQTLYIIMERCDGGELYDRIQKISGVLFHKVSKRSLSRSKKAKHCFHNKLEL